MFIMNNTPHAMLSRIVSTHTTPVNDFIVTRPIWDITSMTREIIANNIITSKQGLSLHDDIAKEYEFATMCNDDLLSDFASRCEYVLNDFDSLIDAYEGESVEYCIMQLFVAFKQYNVIKSRTIVDALMREEFQYVPVVIV